MKLELQRPTKYEISLPNAQKAPQFAYAGRKVITIGRRSGKWGNAIPEMITNQHKTRCFVLVFDHFIAPLKSEDETQK